MNALMEQIAGQLHGKQNGNGWLVRCPAHDDRTPSLSLNESSDGKILLHCFAGCSQDSVISALEGLGLWETKGYGVRNSRKATAKVAVKKLDAPALDLVAPPADTKPPLMGKSVWTYRDSAGAPLLYIERIDSGGGKEFRPHSWDRCSQSWVKKAWPTPRPLYGLDHLTAHPDAPVLICEGEKAADAARKIVGDRFVVVTWPNGAKAVKASDWSPLHGRKVLIWPDADQPGLDAANAITEVLRPHCPEIRVIEIDLENPDAFTSIAGFDAADALGLGWDFEAFTYWAHPKMTERTQKMASETPELKKLEDEEAEENGECRPEIVVNNRHFRDVLAKAWDATLKANAPKPTHFQRHGSMVRLMDRGDHLNIEPMGPDELFGFLAQNADWLRETRDGLMPTKPDRQVARVMLARVNRNLPELTSVLTTPVFGKSGALILSPGYHAEDTAYLDEARMLVVPPVPLAPTADQIQKSRLLLEDVIADFPYARQSDRAHALGAILLPFVRKLIPDCTPLHGVEASIVGSGKSLTVKVVHLIATGRIPEFHTLPSNEDEMRKKITAILARFHRAGPPDFI